MMRLLKRAWRQIGEDFPRQIPNVPESCTVIIGKLDQRASNRGVAVLSPDVASYPDVMT